MGANTHEGVLLVIIGLSFSIAVPHFIPVRFQWSVEFYRVNP